MSSENFESLEDDFLGMKKSLSSKIDDFLLRSSGQARKNLARDIQRELDNAQCLLEDLEREARSAPYPFRQQMNSRLKGYNQDLGSLKKTFSQSESNPRTQLLGQGPQFQSGLLGAQPPDNRSRLLQMNETIENTSQMVMRTQQIAAETDEIGIAVVDELGTQREALVRTKERLVDTDVNLTRSRKILRSMYRRVMTNKLILIVIIILEIAILGGIVYYRFFRK